MAMFRLKVGFRLGGSGKQSRREENRRLPELRSTTIMPMERMSEDNYVQVGGGLQGRKKGATMTPGKLQTTTGTEIQNKKGQGTTHVSTITSDVIMPNVLIFMDQARISLIINCSIRNLKKRTMDDSLLKCLQSVNICLVK